MTSKVKLEEKLESTEDELQYGSFKLASTAYGSEEYLSTIKTILETLDDITALKKKWDGLG